MGEDWGLDTGYGVMGRGGVLGLIQIPRSGVVRAAGLNKHQPCTLNTDHRFWRHAPGCSAAWAGGNNLYQHKHLI